MTRRLHPKRVLVAIFLILLMTGLAAVTGFHRIERLMLARADEPLRLSRAIEEMLAILHEQEHFLENSPEPREEKPPADTREALRQGLTALDAAVGGLLAAEQDSALQALHRGIRGEWETYRRIVQGMLDAEADTDADPQTGLDEFRAASLALRRRLTVFLSATGSDLLRSQEVMQQTTRIFTLLVVACTSLGMLAALFFYYRLTRLFLQPVGHITQFLQHAGSGDLNRRLPHQETTDLQRLASACNRLLANVARAIEESRRRSRSERLVATAVIESRQEPVLAVSNGGDVVLANTAARELMTGADGSGLLQNLTNALTEERDVVEHAKRRFKLKQLQVPGGTRFAGSIVALVQDGRINGDDEHGRGEDNGTSRKHQQESSS